MSDRFRDIARAVVAVLLLGMAGAAAQTAQSPTSPNPGAASQAGSVPTAQAPAQPAGPAGPKINTAEITARANRDVGANIETAIKGWQHELDRLESALQKPRLRYSELNDFRDELQRVRAEIADFSKRLEPRLAAAKDQVALLGPAPAAGQPPEPEQAALNRAELNYLFGLLCRASCGSVRQSADRPAHQHHPGHSPKEFCYQPVPARPGHLLVPDLGKVAGLRALGDEPRSRPRGRVVGQCPRPE